LIHTPRRVSIIGMHVPRDRSSRLTRFARAMRSQPTDAESKLWKILRFKSLCGYRFRRQRPIAGYVLDFYCPSRRLAVELDGGQHADDRQAEYDRTRSARLKELGVRVLRFWDHDVLKDPQAVADEILRFLESLQPPPQPSPGVPGEGE
jgi:ATP-dependent helicase HrpA/adenine-specific DNA-methyltransferase